MENLLQYEGCDVDEKPGTIALAPWARHEANRRWAIITHSVTDMSAQLEVFVWERDFYDLERGDADSITQASFHRTTKISGRFLTKCCTSQDGQDHVIPQKRETATEVVAETMIRVINMDQDEAEVLSESISLDKLDTKCITCGYTIPSLYNPQHSPTNANVEFAMVDPATITPAEWESLKHDETATEIESINPASSLLSLWLHKLQEALRSHVPFWMRKKGATGSVSASLGKAKWNSKMPADYSRPTKSYGHMQ
ncbi:uncharacterized protein FPRN_00844 [Fusarium proliferatum]|nr:uncharacterized protein FPRN_00844 [Fusarium proliferatum]